MKAHLFESSETTRAHHVIDALFGFSFKPPVREPFDNVIAWLKDRPEGLGVTSVDVPSGWSVDEGPEATVAEDDSASGSKKRAVFMPDVLVSLTCPKPASQFFKGRHFVGGRFVDAAFAERWGFEIPDYEGLEQVAEVEGASKI